MGRQTLVLWLAAVVTAATASRPATAQSALFRSAATFALPGSTNDATGLFALTDVASPNGPPDGIPDVVTVEQTMRAIVLLGNGDGTFGSTQGSNLSGIPAALAVADFDGDGLKDLLVADTSNLLQFYRNTASFPLFKAQGTPVAAGDSPVALAAADLNGDGKLDAIVVNQGLQVGNVKILLGNGDGTFQEYGEPFAAGAGSSAVAVADFNGDSKLDLAVTNSTDGSVSILLGNGTGFFTAGQTISVGEDPQAIAPGDLNADGRVDLVVSNRNSDNVAVLDGVGDGTFKAARFFDSGSSGSYPSGLALADVNADGHLDALVPNNRSSDVGVLLGDGHGSFASPRVFVADESPLAVAAADVNGDGIADAVTVNGGAQFGAPSAAVLLSLGNGSLSAIEDVVTLPSTNLVTAGDANNDGLCDLIVGQGPQTANGPGAVSVHPAQPGGGFGTPVTLQPSGDVTAVSAGDFNDDGRLDIAVANKSTANVSVFLGLPHGGFTAAQNYAIGPRATALSAADFNHDGRTDLAITEQRTDAGGGQINGTLQVLLAAADGSFGAPSDVPVGVGPGAVAAGDFNEDGNVDLVVADNASGDVVIVTGDGHGGFVPGATIGNLRSPKSLAVADFDRDGHDDVVVAQPMEHDAVVLYGNGQGNLTPSTVPLSVPGTPSAVAARDVTGDAIPDVLLADQVANAVVVFTGQGSSRRFQQTAVLTISRQPVDITAADVDGDGRYDVIAANTFVGSASVLTNVGATATARGDGNGDGLVTAADMVAVVRELADGGAQRAEDVSRGSFAAAPGVDANGDGAVTRQDVAATAHWLF